MNFEKEMTQVWLKGAIARWVLLRESDKWLADRLRAAADLIDAGPPYMARTPTEPNE